MLIKKKKKLIPNLYFFTASSCFPGPLSILQNVIERKWSIRQQEILYRVLRRIHLEKLLSELFSSAHGFILQRDEEKEEVVGCGCAVTNAVKSLLFFFRPSKHSFIKGRAKQSKTALIATSPRGDRGTRWWFWVCSMATSRGSALSKCLNSKWLCDNKKIETEKSSPSIQQKLTRLNPEESVTRATSPPNKQTAALFPTGCPTAFLRAFRARSPGR